MIHPPPNGLPYILLCPLFIVCHHWPRVRIFQARNLSLLFTDVSQTFNAVWAHNRFSIEICSIKGKFEVYDIMGFHSPSMGGKKELSVKLWSWLDLWNPHSTLIVSFPYSITCLWNLKLFFLNQSLLSILSFRPGVSLFSTRLICTLERKGEWGGRRLGWRETCEVAKPLPRADLSKEQKWVPAGPCVELALDSSRS